MEMKDQLETMRHWDKVYETKAENEVSWFQPYPKASIMFVELFDLPLDANIIDVGGGDSYFAEALLDKGYQNIYVLDISAKAIEKAKQRLKERASKINWIVSDIIEFKPPVQFDLWHDRATFHFLTSEDKISKYVSVAENTIKKNGYLVVGTFSENGPEKCSGLQIKQYSEESMVIRLKDVFNKIKCVREDHVTPFNTVQNFLFCSFQKTIVKI
jgi:2-polyprenyl-3-methyl-5-hydroxy-6-metoxy-1,4-benzoquinol methylase